MDALFNDEVLIKSQQRFRSDHHKVYTEEVHKIALSSNDDSVSYGTNVFSYNVSYGTNVFKVCEDEMQSKKKND